MSKLTGPVGMLVVVGVLLLAAAHIDSYTPNQRGVSFRRVSSSDDTNSRRAIRAERPASELSKLDRRSAHDKNNRWEHQACYMVVARPSTLVRVHSGSWPDSKWIKQPVDNNGFEHKLCHYDECNSLSIDTCRRLLRHMRAPDGWKKRLAKHNYDDDDYEYEKGQDGRPYDVCMVKKTGKGDILNEGVMEPVTYDIYSSYFNTSKRTNDHICHLGYCEGSSVSRCGPWSVIEHEGYLPVWIKKGGNSKLYPLGSGKIEWIEQVPDICVKINYELDTNLTVNIYSINENTFRPTPARNKCHDGHCTQASIKECGPWISSADGFEVDSRPSEPYWVKDPSDEWDRGKGFIKWRRLPNDICVKQVTKHYDGGPPPYGQTVKIFSHNSKVYHERRNTKKCHDGYCSAASIPFCGPWQNSTDGDHVEWVPDKSHEGSDGMPGDGQSSWAWHDRVTAKQSSFNLNEDDDDLVAYQL